MLAGGEKIQGPVPGDQRPVNGDGTQYTDADAQVQLQDPLAAIETPPDVLTFLEQKDELMFSNPDQRMIQVWQGSDAYAIFNVPGIFDVRPREEICVESDRVFMCVGPDSITPDMSPVKFLRDKGDKGVAEILGKGAGGMEMPAAISDAYADYYLLYGIANGQIKVSQADELYMRLHAIALLKETQAAVNERYVVPMFDPSNPGFTNPLSPYLSDTWTPFGNPLAALGIADPDGAYRFGNPAGYTTQTIEEANPGADRFIQRQQMNLLVNDPEMKAVYAIELAHARTELIDAVRDEAAQSYYDHSKEISELEHIEDPQALAAAIDKLMARIKKGKKLATMLDAAMGTGSSAIIGGKKIDLINAVKVLSETNDDVEFAKGVLDFKKKLDLVVLSNGIDEIVKLADECANLSDEVVVGRVGPNPNDTLANAATATGAKGVGMAVLSHDAGVRHSYSYKKYFLSLKQDALEARRRLDGGDVDGAKAIVRQATRDPEFKRNIYNLQHDLELTQKVKFSAKIAIIIAAACIANAAGGYVGALLAGLEAPAWLIGVGTLAAESLAFLVSEKTLSFAVLGELPFDPKIGFGGNALGFLEEWVKVALMFKFLRWGVGRYNRFVKELIVRRSVASLLEEGAITEAELLKMGGETAEKIAARAKLTTTGQILNFGGLFTTEYISFTVWDYLTQTYEASKAEGGFALPKDFFTGPAFLDRFIFLGCLKIGGALASPFTSALQSKAAASLMEKYSPQLKAYEAEVNGLLDELAAYDKAESKDPAKLDSIFTRMKEALRHRRNLEDSLAKVDPKLISSSAQTRAVLENVERMSSERVILEWMQRGECPREDLPTLKRLLAEGKKTGFVDYEVADDGTIKVRVKIGGGGPEFTVERDIRVTEETDQPSTETPDAGKPTPAVPVSDGRAATAGPEVPIDLEPGTYRVPLDQIIPTQGAVFVDKVADYLSSDPDSTELPQVWIIDGKMYVVEGHHRLMAAYLRGDADVAVEVVGPDFLEAEEGLIPVLHTRQPGLTRWDQVSWRSGNGTEIISPDVARQRIADKTGVDATSDASADFTQADLARWLAEGRSMQELQAKIGVDGMRRLGYGNDMPFGFNAREDYDYFRQRLVEELLGAGIPIFNPDIRIEVQGSSATGVKGETGTDFRWEPDPLDATKAGKKSDLDVTVVVTPRVYAELVVRRVQWLMQDQRSIPADFRLAAIATLKWLDTLNLDEGRAADDASLQNIKGKAESREILQHEILEMLGGIPDLSIGTADAEGLEWWQYVNDKSHHVERSMGAKKLESALAQKKISSHTTDGDVRAARATVLDDMIAAGMGNDFELQLSFMLPESRFYPGPEATMPISAGAVFTP